MAEIQTILQFAVLALCALVAAVAVAATAVAGGAATVVPEVIRDDRRRTAQAERDRTPRQAAATQVPTAIPTTPPPPAQWSS